MTNNELREEAKRLTASVRLNDDDIFSVDIAAFLKALDKLIDSEESAWQQLEEMKDAEAALMEQRDLGFTLKVQDN